MKYRLLFIFIHALAGWLSLSLAFRLRFYFDPLIFKYDMMLLQTFPVAMLCKAMAADALGLTRRIWRYASFRDVAPVCFAAGAGSLLFVPVAIWMEGTSYPNGPLLLDFILTLGFFTAIRFSGRFWVEARHLFRGSKALPGSRVLILGSGDRGEMALRFMQSGNRVVGFLDDQKEIQGRLLLGVPVLGRLADLRTVLEKKPVDEVVIALDQPGPERIREVFEIGSSAGCRVSLMPELSPASQIKSNPIRELKMSDFLGREPVKLDPAPLISALGGMTVLVTGAGGSIGSELCRQIAALPVKKLLLLDNSENALFEISEEIGGGKEGSSTAPVVSDLRPPLAAGASFGQAISPGRWGVLRAGDLRPPIAVLLCDIRFREDLEAVFKAHTPDVVYHAAACKHVPMMELHPLDAARTNVLGTRNVVELAQQTGVKRFLHVSTDKVVEAEGIMGASKAWGERIVRSAGYSCVRFGNVLGSNGSVIPLFEKQWTRQGHLQVTHSDATRYFMTIEEAVLLILHAEAIKGSGEVYILDMGEPVKILDLARQVVALKGGGGPEAGDRLPEGRPSGQGKSEVGDRSADTPVPAEVGGEKSEADPGIRIVGLRPGERVHERLHTPTEQLEATPVPKVNKLTGSFEAADLENRLKQLENLLVARDMEGIRKMLIDK